MKNITRQLAAAGILCMICKPVSAQVEPLAGQWKTWVIPSASAMRLPPPPDEYGTNAELGHVRQMISQTTPDVASQVTYWNAGSPGYRWMQIADQEVVSHGLGAPLATRALALVAAAIYDGTLAAWDSKYAYNRPRPSALDATIQTAVAPPDTPSYPSEHAVTAASAVSVLAYLFPDDAANLNKLAQQAAASRLFAGTEFPSDSAAGLQLGQAVGAAVVSYAKADGSDAVFTGSFPDTPGKWSNANPAQPLAGMWKPWALIAGNQFRPAAPPAAGSTAMAAQLTLVKNLNRTTAISHTAWFWQPSFFGPWLDALNQVVFESGLDQNAPRAARTYALALFAQHDATLACWDAKYTYLEQRPSMADPTITPLFPNPAHPGFPSGHACASSGVAQVLGYLFPSEAQAFSAMAMDAGESTFDAAIHLQSDVDGGLALGKSVGQVVVTAAQQDGSQ